MLSEIVRPRPAATVVDWLGSVADKELAVSVLTFGELAKGVAKLPAGAKKAQIDRWLRRDLVDRFAGRTLPVDPAVAFTWGELVGAAEADGAPLPVVDALLGATALVHGLTVVTRNVRHLERCAPVLNPWQ